jgi:hypothetical protein
MTRRVRKPCVEFVALYVLVLKRGWRRRGKLVFSADSEKGLR